MVGIPGEARFVPRFVRRKNIAMIAVDACC
jgi:hypothetical protein